MPILASQIELRLSGGAGNSVPLASLGGGKSNTLAGINLFDDVPSAEGAAGDTEYRCIYVHNGHPTLSLENAFVWFQANTPSPDTVVAIGLGTSALNATEQAVASEDTAPAGITFLTPTDKASGIALGTIPPGQHRALWIRRVVSAGASVFADSFTVAIEGDTLP